MTIAGTDPSGAAGIQVDLQVFRDFGYHGLSAISAVVSQNTVGVRAYEPMSARTLQGQLDALMEDIPMAGIKIGMLPTAEAVEVTARFLDAQPACPVVLDPVLTSGDGKHSLIGPGGSDALLARLLPRVSVVTPNVNEAQVMLGRSLETMEDLLLAAEDLCRLGCPGVLLKAGHLAGESAASTISDVWADARGARVLEGLTRIDVDVRGTGCQLSSALSCALVDGLEPLDAAEKARHYLNVLLQSRVHSPGRGRPIIIRVS
ncbi:MAG: bifunctional hydroxymethylpyrimidine kinase/phosphomethylpyrimidine kinase, partial [Bradymonadaceae bacterium]